MKNFEDKFGKFKWIIDIWSQRDLAIKGNIALVRSLVIYHHRYTTSLLYVIPLSIK